VRKLERHGAPDETVGAFGEPDRTHASLTERADQAIRSDHASADEMARRLRPGRRAELRQRIEKIPGLHPRAVRQQIAQLRLQRIAFRGQRFEPREALARRAVECFVEESIELGGGLRIDIEPGHRDAPGYKYR